MASGISDVDDPSKRTFLKKFGRRMGNVFSKKRNSRGLTEEEFSVSGAQPSSSVIRNPLMDNDMPSAELYAPASRPVRVGAPSELRSGGDRQRMYGDTGRFVTTDDNLAGRGPPERCLSEGDLVEAGPPRSEPLGGRIWRAVPGSMDNLPKAMLGELSRKINSRGHSGSEDEGLPHSPPTETPQEASSQSGPSALLSQSSKSLISCGDSSDGERNSAELMDLDFNVLRRAESLDNTAAKHRIQVGRQRRKSPAGAGHLRKHKSCTSVQLAGISEEAAPKEEALRRQTSHDPSGPENDGMRLARELQEMQEREKAKREEKAREEKKKEEKKKEEKKKEKKMKEKDEAAASRPFPGPSALLPTLKPTRAAPLQAQQALSAGPTPPVGPTPSAGPTSGSTGPTNSAALAASRIERLRSMFVTTDLNEASSKPPRDGSGPSRVLSLTESSAAPAPVLTKAASLSSPAKGPQRASGTSLAFSAGAKNFSLPERKAERPTPGPKVPTGSTPGPKVPTGSTPGPKVPTGSSAAPKVPTGSSAGSKVPAGSSAAPKVPTGSSAGPKVPAGSSAALKVPTGSSAGPKVPAGSSAAPKVSAGSAPAPKPTSRPTFAPKTASGYSTAAHNSSASSKTFPSSETGPKPQLSSAGVALRPGPKSSTGPGRLSSAKDSLASVVPPKSLPFEAAKASSSDGSMTSPTSPSKLAGSITFTASTGANSRPANISLKDSTSVNNKSAFPDATSKACDSSSARGGVLLREKKSPESPEEPRGRPVSRVMDLVRNFQRLQESSTS